MEIKKTWKEKGFTMAELLIVVAIIAVLAAIAIPIFNAQLEKSREGTDADTLRNAYAKAALVALDGKKTDEFEYTPASATDPTIKVTTATDAGLSFVQEQQNWTELGDFEIGGLEIKEGWSAPLKGETYPVTFTFGENGDLTKLEIGTNGSAGSYPQS